MATKKPKKSSAIIDEPEDAVEIGVDAADDSDEDDSSDLSASSDFDSDSDDDDSSASVSPLDDHMVDYSVKSREMARQTLNEQIAAFLAKGGQINHIENNVTADPPRKPTSNYGSRPI